MTLKLPMANGTPTVSCERLHATLTRSSCAARFAGSRAVSAYATGHSACMGCPIGEVNAKREGTVAPVERLGAALRARWKGAKSSGPEETT